ncbi:MAG: HesA/MoeB/ThiF family protein [Syntrophaceae bacterium]|nr:HesA/MoeB/ThiF family protein [Syntrophaceae bacterium]
MEKSLKVMDGAGREIRYIDDAAAFSISMELLVNMGDVYCAALEQEIYPYRYIRNRNVISAREQLKLALCKIAVIGAGGLGGCIIQLLARIGIGHLVVADYDVFDETNLNRQTFSSGDVLGKSKTSVVADHIAKINRGVQLTTFQNKIDFLNANKIVTGCNAVVDALDNISDRFILESASKKQGIPLVHGTLAGFEGRIMTIFPDDAGLKLLYGADDLKPDVKASAESILGVPAITPSIVATYQAMEVIKIILHRGEPFRNMMVYIDLESGSIEKFLFPVDGI